MMNSIPLSGAFLGVSLSAVLCLSALQAADAAAEVKNISITGGVEDGKARLTIEAVLNALMGNKEKLIYATALQHSVKVERDKLVHSITAAQHRRAESAAHAKAVKALADFKKAQPK